MFLYVLPGSNGFAWFTMVFASTGCQRIGWVGMDGSFNGGQ